MKSLMCFQSLLFISSTDIKIISLPRESILLKLDYYHDIGSIYYRRQPPLLENDLSYSKLKWLCIADRLRLLWRAIRIRDIHRLAKTVEVTQDFEIIRICFIQCSQKQPMQRFIGKESTLIFSLN